MAFLAAGAISAAAAATWPLFCKYIAGQKGKQTLDPVHTVCMLALKVFETYKDGLPGIYDHAFWLTTEKATRFEFLNKVPKMKEGVRAYYGLTHEDFGLLLPNIRLFTKHWKAENEPELVEIAKWAVKGLELIPKSPTYVKKEDGECKYPNVEALCTLYAEILNNWIAKATPLKNSIDGQNGNHSNGTATSPSAISAPNQTAPLPDVATLKLSSPSATETTSSPTPAVTLEEAFVQQIKTNWPGEKLRDYVSRHKMAKVGELEKSLMDQHGLHKLDLEKAAKDGKQPV